MKKKTDKVETGIRPRENFMQHILRDINHQMFPGGKDEEDFRIWELFEMFEARYPMEVIRRLQRFVLAQLLLTDKDKRSVVDSVTRRNDNNFTDEDAGTLYDYAVMSDKRLRLKYGCGS